MAASLLSLPLELQLRALGMCTAASLRALSQCCSKLRSLLPLLLQASPPSPIPLPLAPVSRWAAALVKEEASLWLRAHTVSPSSPSTISSALTAAMGADAEELELYCPYNSSASQRSDARLASLLPCVRREGVPPVVAATALLAGSLNAFPSDLDLLHSVAQCIQMLLTPSTSPTPTSSLPPPSAPSSSVAPSPTQPYTPDCMPTPPSSSLRASFLSPSLSLSTSLPTVPTSTSPSSPLPSFQPPTIARAMIAGGLLPALLYSASRLSSAGVNAIAPCLALLASHGQHAALLAAGPPISPLPLLISELCSEGTREPASLHTSPSDIRHP